MTGAGPTYVPLWCKSNFSFLEGASGPEDLVQEAARHGLPALVLTDRNGVYGIVRAHVEARRQGIKLVVGTQMSLEDGSSILLLAQDKGGYANLCQLITAGQRRNPKGQCSVSWREICEKAKGLIALWGGDEALSSQEIEPLAVASMLRDAFGDRIYALCSRHLREGEPRQEARLRLRAKRYGFPLVAANEVLYHRRERRDLQDILTCIRHGVKIQEASQYTKPNSQYGLQRPERWERLFQYEPDWRHRTLEIAERCNFDLGQLRYRYPAQKLPGSATADQWLRDLVFRGVRERYGKEPSTSVIRQIERELALIKELDYGGYFLGMHEIVEFCRRKKILCQGRGSAANSVVCYALGITAIDPVRMGLLFERFISRERAEPPDIDLDIEHERREEVIQHVYKKFGRSHAAMVAVVIRYRARSALREVGKALGIGETTLHRLSRLAPGRGPIESNIFEEAGLPGENPIWRNLLRLANEILDFPRHLSIHPGGFLLGHEPITGIVPVENGAKADRTIIQWDKDDVEALGLFKVDLLGLGALSHLRRCFQLIQRHRGIRLSMARIPPGDPETYKMLQQGDTVGVFQLESRAQMSMLPRLLPRHFHDLVIEISIVRPGPITGGMVHPYLRRRNGEEPVTYPHPSLEPILKKTLGVPLFQEQVMRLAMVAADYTPGEADQLRRDMAAWRKPGNMERHHKRLVERMMKKGIPFEFAEGVVEQIRGFGEYGFPESHAASFALISYATAYLRRHYPAEFTCALLNAQPMGFYSTDTILKDAQRHGLEILPVDISRSDFESTLEEVAPGCLSVRMGFRTVKGLRGSIPEELILARDEQPFRGIEDFAQRVRLDRKGLTLLAESGALECLGISRRDAIWQARDLSRLCQPLLPWSSRQDSPSFRPLTKLETILWDLRATGHSSRGHPLALLRSELKRIGCIEARRVPGLPSGAQVRYAGIVICRQRPRTAGGVTFMTLEDETGFANLVLWKRVYERQRLLARSASFLGVTGKVENQRGVSNIIVDQLWIPDLRLLQDPKP